jgi:hypothetical protein
VLELAMRHTACLFLLIGSTVLIHSEAVAQRQSSAKITSRELIGTTQTHPTPPVSKLCSTDRLTAYSITIPAHGSTAVNPHPSDYLLISLSTIDLEASGSSGISYPLHLEQEEMQVMKGGWAHRLANHSDVPTKLIEIDVQHNIAPEHALCGLSVRPCMDGRFGRNQEGTYSTSTLFETPKVKLTKIELGPKGVFETHAHPGSAILIPLTAIHLADTGQISVDKDVGEAQAYAARTSHQLRNLGTETVRFLEFEAK